MKIKIDSLINKYSQENQSCVIVGSGHTMNEFDYLNFNGKNNILWNSYFKIKY